MIKAIIFDVGGVLVRTEDRSSRREWENELGLSDWQADEVVFNSDMGRRAQLGEVTDEALWQWIGEHLQLEDRLEKFRTGFWAGDRLDKALVATIRKLRRSHMTAIISNATDALRLTLSERLKIDDAFDLIVISAEEKVMKPDALIFQRTLERLGCEPSEAVFIDDFAHNIEAAKALGMKTIHYRPGTDVPKALAKLGVEIPETAYA